MTMKKYLFLIAAAMLTLTDACVRELADNNQPETKQVKMVFKATTESIPGTKAELAGKQVLWSPGDSISVFNLYTCDYYAGAIFRTSLTEPSPTADFEGVLEIQGDMPEDGIVAVYPVYRHCYDMYGYDNSYSFNWVSVCIPCEQHAVAGSFDPTAFISIARSKTSELHFHNVCGGVALRFSEGCEDYEYVIFKVLDDTHYITGDVCVDVGDDDGIPKLASSTGNTYEWVKLYAPEEGFQAGVDYFICTLEDEMTKGFSLEFKRKDGKVAYKAYPKAQEIKRSVFGRISGFNTSLQWFDSQYAETDISTVSHKWKYTNNDNESWIADINTTFPDYLLLYPESDPMIYWDVQNSKTVAFHIDSVRLDNFTGEIALFLSSGDYSYERRFTQENGTFKANFADPEGEFTEMTVSDVQPKYYAIETDNAQYPVFFNSSYGDIQLFRQIADANGGQLPILYIDGVGTTSDFEGKDVTGKVAIVNRGSITFQEKMENAAAAGAIGILIVNHVPTVISPNFQNAQDLIPGAILPFEIKDHLAGKTSLKFVAVGIEPSPAVSSAFNPANPFGNNKEIEW